MVIDATAVNFDNPAEWTQAILSLRGSSVEDFKVGGRVVKVGWDGFYDAESKLTKV